MRFRIFKRVEWKNVVLDVWYVILVDILEEVWIMVSDRVYIVELLEVYDRKEIEVNGELGNGKIS